MSRASRTALAGTVLAAAMTLAPSRGAAADPAASMIGRPAPPFRLTDVLSGQTVSLEGLRGRIVVLHFGASW